VEGMLTPLHTHAADERALPPVRARLRVFARPRTAQDALPTDLGEQLVSFPEQFARTLERGDRTEPRIVTRLPFRGRIFRAEPDPELFARLEALREEVEQLGTHDVNDSRLLLRDLGTYGLNLYAIPTTTGSVGFHVLGTDRRGLSGGSVARALPDGIAWQIAYRRKPGGPTHSILFGLASDEVATVDVELRGATARTALADNGFFYEAEGKEPTEITGLIVTEHGGASRHVPAST
jgi:hypothetical protein